MSPADEITPLHVLPLYSLLSTQKQSQVCFGFMRMLMVVFRWILLIFCFCIQCHQNLNIDKKCFEGFRTFYCKGCFIMHDIEFNFKIHVNRAGDTVLKVGAKVTSGEVGIWGTAGQPSSRVFSFIPCPRLVI